MLSSQITLADANGMIPVIVKSVRLAAGVAFALVLAACSASVPDTSASIAPTAVDPVVVTSPGPETTNGAFPIIGLVNDDATFAGGAAVFTSQGPDYELEWGLWGGSVEIWAQASPPEAFADNVTHRASPGEAITGLTIRGLQAYRVVEAGGIVYMWYEQGATMYLRLRNLDHRADGVIGSLEELTTGQVADLTGGWIDLTEE